MTVKPSFYDPNNIREEIELLKDIKREINYGRSPYAISSVEKIDLRIATLRGLLAINVKQVIDRIEDEEKRHLERKQEQAAFNMAFAKAKREAGESLGDIVREMGEEK